MKVFPKFSAYVCVYIKDDPKHFREAVESIINQTVPPNEVVIVVDGPISNELDSIVSAYDKLEAFKVIRLPRNMGHGYARKIALANCKNDIVALMDSDDIASSDRFEKQLAVFESDVDVSLVGGQISEFIGDEKNIVGTRIVPLTDSEIKEFLKKRCPMNHVSVMFKKSQVEKAGGYQDWFCNEDYYLWIRMYLAGMKFANVPDVLVNVRVGKDMYKRRGGWKYFVSEFRLQNYMLEHKVIGLGTYIVNITKRFIAQVLLPAEIRGWAYKKFARNNSLNG